MAHSFPALPTPQHAIPTFDASLAVLLKCFRCLPAAGDVQEQVLGQLEKEFASGVQKRFGNRTGGLGL